MAGSASSERGPCWRSKLVKRASERELDLNCCFMKERQMLFRSGQAQPTGDRVESTSNMKTSSLEPHPRFCTCLSESYSCGR